jgi:hypothetical protein
MSGIGDTESKTLDEDAIENVIPETTTGTDTNTDGGTE